jgi:hypothetical protein
MLAGETFLPMPQTVLNGPNFLDEHQHIPTQYTQWN